MVQQSDNPSATVAIVLSRLPQFKHWANQPLETAWRQALDQADTQTLMTVAAHALKRIAIEQMAS